MISHCPRPYCRLNRTVGLSELSACQYCWQSRPVMISHCPRPYCRLYRTVGTVGTVGLSVLLAMYFTVGIQYLLAVLTYILSLLSSLSLLSVHTTVPLSVLSATVAGGGRLFWLTRCQVLRHVPPVDSGRGWGAGANTVENSDWECLLTHVLLPSVAGHCGHWTTRLCMRQQKQCRIDLQNFFFKYAHKNSDNCEIMRIQYGVGRVYARRKHITT